MDELDKLILQTLQEDGRTPFTQIARQAGVSETTIRSRYRNLVEEGIIRRAIAELPEVSYLVMTLGPFDLIIEVFCRDLPHLTNLITQQIRLIPGVRSTETLMIARSYKLTYRWSPALGPEAGATTD